MSKAETRLELLKIVHRHDHRPELVITRAKALEAWVNEEETKSQPTPEAKASGKGSKKDTDENSILS